MMHPWHPPSSPASHALSRRRLRALVCCAWLLAVGLALPACAAPAALQVMHWWTSVGERRAADQLASRLAEEGIAWKDAAVPGGGGQGAGKVLRNRVLAGDAPDVTQIIGASIDDWGQMGLLLELDGVARADRWSTVLLPVIDRLIRHRQHVVAAPLGIHRLNAMYYNRQVLSRLHLTPPTTWTEFEQVAATFHAAGITPLAQSAEPWQVAGLFEALVLAEGGPSLHRALFMHHSANAAGDPRLAQALQRLRRLKGWMGGPPVERPWSDEVRRVLQGEAAMLVMGDWAKAEFNALGAVLDKDYGCTAVPGTAHMHLYSVDTLAMLAKDYAQTAAQERLAHLLVTPALQAEYNALKGSVPVRRDADPARMDHCARESWTAFTRDNAQLAPSLVHRMATEEASKEALIAEIHRYFLDDSITPQAAQKRLAAMLPTLPRRATRPIPRDPN